MSAVSTSEIIFKDRGSMTVLLRVAAGVQVILSTVQFVSPQQRTPSQIEGMGGKITTTGFEIANISFSSVIVSSSFSNCYCSSTGLGEWVFVEGYTVASLIVPSSWSITPQLSNPTDVANLVETDMNELADFNNRTVIVDSISLSETLSFSTNDITLSSPSPSTTISVSSTAAFSTSGNYLALAPATKETTDLILNNFYGMDSSHAEVSLLQIWNEHTSGDVNVVTSGHSHVNCGLVQLPPLPFHSDQHALHGTFPRLPRTLTC
ncbi:hypothetical protein BLNAU_23451 [Blattamonas nauphoetae]|uniref:Uncharacterized protein n=1 Tax=Blattamonas nauphoetae TaxID=2049346 RepID=A0ABQ9WQ78_9EUKA|nr:hypothetical protein BLNAU_23451 [Blattamonas nauphoetae]